MTSEDDASKAYASFGPDRGRSLRPSTWVMTAKVKGSSGPQTKRSRVSPNSGHMPCIIEGFVEFAFEASVSRARRRTALSPPTIRRGTNTRHHILRRSTVSGRDVAETLAQEAVATARRDRGGASIMSACLASSCSSRTMAEADSSMRSRRAFTIRGTGRSKACVISQFEQHIRAVAGWPLGDPTRHSDAVMENIIGEEVGKLARA